MISLPNGEHHLGQLNMQYEVDPIDQTREPGQKMIKTGYVKT